LETGGAPRQVFLLDLPDDALGLHAFKLRIDAPHEVPVEPRPGEPHEGTCVVGAADGEWDLADFVHSPGLLEFVATGETS